MKFIRHPEAKLTGTLNPNRRWQGIVCSELMMAKCLGLLNNEPWEKFSYLVRSEWNPTPRDGEQYLFRHGAKLCRNLNKPAHWWIYGYAADKCDVGSAYAELKAAYAMYQAQSWLFAVDEWGKTPNRSRLTYRGMWGTYPNGQRSPSELNYEPNVRETDN